MARNILTRLAVLVFVIGGMAISGCKTVPVDILSANAPDALLPNETGTFSITTNADAKQPVEVTWTFGDNESSAGAATTHSFASSGTYTVTALATNNKGKFSDSRSFTVVVAPPPVPASIVSLSANNMSPDTRTQVRFSASTNGDAPLTYSWDLGDGASSTMSNPTHTYERPGTYTVSLTLANPQGSDSRTMSLTVAWYEAAICREIAELDAVMFDRNSSVLSDDGRGTLDNNLQILTECPNMNVRLEGVSAPGERRAQELSDDRARAVETYYESNGVSASRMVTNGLGRAQGLTSKKEGLAQYRRVDTVIIR
ncbi:MAG: PKD domain-containing protein [Bacteroidetes bacterium]|nr:MAG: PKD domain-containing protein [Bacteroidota bacterium]